MLKYIKAKLYNWDAGRSKNQPDKIIETLSPQPNQHIADIGAGGGYFSFRFADGIKKGKVYAVDISEKFLKFISQEAVRRGYVNVITVMVKNSAPSLPPKSIDLIFTRNVYHHLANRVEYFRELKEALTDTGRIAIIDFAPDKSLFTRVTGHCIQEQIIKNEMEQAGYRLVQSYNFLPWQSFFIFTPSGNKI